MYRHIPQVVTDSGIPSFANSVVPDINTQHQHTQHQIWAEAYEKVSVAKVGKSVK